MSTVHEQIQDIIRGLNAHPDVPIEQEMILEQFNQVIPKDHELTLEEKAEGLAFSFADRFAKAEDGYYFGPRVTMRGEDGLVYESPSLKEVQPAMIEYWKNRAGSVQHPNLVARYAGLAWDLTSAVTGKQPDHALRRRFIQASLDVVRQKLFTHPPVGARWIGRTLEIISKFNDQDFFVPLKDLTLAFERESDDPKKPGPWGFTYDLLINNKRINLSTAEEKEIIDRLEQKLIHYSTPNGNGKPDPWACEHAVSRLAEYYKRKNLPEEVKRVVLAVGKAYEPLFAGSSALQVAGWMQKLHQLYVYHQLNEEAEILLKQLRAVSAKGAEEMGGFEHPFHIPKEEADALVDSFYAQGAEKAIEQIVARFVPDKDKAKQSLFELARQAPMQYSFPIQLTDHKGRVIANIGSLEKDEDGHILLRISEQLTISGFFLHLVLERGQSNGMLSKPSVLTFLSHSAIIHQNRFTLLEKALDYYFSGDYIGFVHVAIPQIEEAIRNLVEISGGKTLRYKDGVYQLRTFDDVLRDSTVTSVCGENIQLYFRIVFTDPRGWNLRNDICHGLAESELFSEQMANRVLHALLILGMIWKAEAEV